jgi:DNA-binding transcriptional ArsR family regulator
VVASSALEATAVVPARRFDDDRRMEHGPSFARLGALLGDPARANILDALTDGRAFTAKELAYHARVSPPTASSHLAKLLAANLVAVERSGRYRFYRIVDPALADLLEQLAVYLPHRPVPERRRSRAPERLRTARMCYDHLAGRLGVAITEALVAAGHLEVLAQDYGVTAGGARFLAGLGIEIEQVKRQRRAFARRDLDWSERRHHLGGALGAALTATFVEREWLRRERGDRRVEITDHGRRALDLLFPDLLVDGAAVRAGPRAA